MLISNTKLTNFPTWKVSEVSVPITQKSDAVIILDNLLVVSTTQYASEFTNLQVPPPAKAS